MAKDQIPQNRVLVDTKRRGFVDRAPIRASLIDKPIADPPNVQFWRANAASWHDPKDQQSELSEGKS